ncbi:exported hypothetical protein [Streptomyces misionensis JCM 4497]
MSGRCLRWRPRRSAAPAVGAAAACAPPRRVRHSERRVLPHRRQPRRIPYQVVERNVTGRRASPTSGCPGGVALLQRESVRQVAPAEAAAQASGAGDVAHVPCIAGALGADSLSPLRGWRPDGA